MKTVKSHSNKIKNFTNLKFAELIRQLRAVSGICRSGGSNGIVLLYALGTVELVFIDCVRMREFLYFSLTLAQSQLVPDDECTLVF